MWLYYMAPRRDLSTLDVRVKTNYLQTAVSYLNESREMKAMDGEAWRDASSEQLHNFGESDRIGLPAQDPTYPSTSG